MEDSSATHPCERVFGSCTSGNDCPFKDAPRSACVAFLKGRCRFGAKCREPHVVSHQGKFVSALHPCIRIYGSCRYGEECEYAKMSSDTCIKFLKGRCTFGDRCKEQHPNAFSSMQAMMGGMMPGMGMLPFGMPFGFQMPGMGGEDAGALRGGKRARDSEGGGPWKKQVGFDSSQMFGNMANYFQSTGMGQFHPCVRIYGTCRDGNSCPYAGLPWGACLQFVKGNCKFGDTCRELHVQMPAAAARQSRKTTTPGTKHPCERIYGFCQDGERCRYADFPVESCLMFLKGKCKFGDSCRELHTREPSKNEETQSSD